MTPSCAPIRCNALWIVLLGNRDSRIIRRRHPVGERR
jgi:hypothetical protein